MNEKENQVNKLLEQQKLHEIIRKIPLGKIPVYNKQNIKRDQEIKWTLNVSNFRQYFKQNTQIKCVPIVISYGKMEKNNVQYLTLMKTESGKCDIGISMQFDDEKESIGKVTGIHIDKKSVLEQHHLAMTHSHNQTCKCLDSWNGDTCITHLVIGDVNRAKMEYQRLKEKVQMLENGDIGGGNVLLHTATNKPTHYLGYYPPISDVDIPMEIKTKVFPSQIKENNIQNIYSYLQKTIAINRSLNSNVMNGDKRIVILNCDLHHTETGETVYFMIKKIDSTKAKKYQWTMKGKAFKKSQIERHYEIPPSPRSDTSFTSQLSYKEKVENIIKEQMSEIMKKVKWNKIKIFNKENQKQRLILQLNKRSFLEQYQEGTCDDLIPILLFDNKGYSIHYLKFIKIGENDLGLSLQYHTKKEKLFITGIHLDKKSILNNHQLVLPQHECHCLDKFTSNITHLRIEDFNSKSDIVDLPNLPSIDDEKEEKEAMNDDNGINMDNDDGDNYSMILNEELNQECKKKDKLIEAQSQLQSSMR